MGIKDTHNFQMKTQIEIEILKTERLIKLNLMITKRQRNSILKGIMTELKRRLAEEILTKDSMNSIILETTLNIRKSIKIKKEHINLIGM